MFWMLPLSKSFKGGGRGDDILQDTRDNVSRVMFSDDYIARQRKM